MTKNSSLATADTLQIVNKNFWNELEFVYKNDKENIGLDTMGYAHDWGVAMQQELARTHEPLTKELAERVQPPLKEERMTYKLMADAAREVLYGTWEFGEELAAAYQEDMAVIRNLRAYGHDDNTAKRTGPRPSGADIEADEKRRYLAQKIALEEARKVMDGKQLAQLKDENIEFKDAAYFKKYLTEHPERTRVLTLFLKLSQKMMREEKDGALTAEVLREAAAKIQSHFPTDKSLDPVIIRSWKHGNAYGKISGYSADQIAKMQPFVSRVFITPDR